MFSKPLLHVLLIVFLGLAVYSNTFDVPFLFDDKTNIVNNPIIKSDVPPDALLLFKTRFVGNITFALNYSLHGLDVFGYHIVNTAIHIINAILVYCLILLTFRTPFMARNNIACKDISSMALVSSLLFVCHPIQTGAVTYIVQRFASLATMFYMLALTLYISYRLRQPGRTKYLIYVLAFISAIAAMFTKEISFTLPVVIVLYEYMFFEGKTSFRIAFLAPFILTMSIIPLLVSETLGSFETVRLADMSRLQYLLTQFTVLLVYLKLLFFPVDQNFDYDYPVYDSLLDPIVFLSLVCLTIFLGLGMILFYLSRNRSADSVCFRPAAFGIFWFFITLSVESSIIPIPDVIFEHRMYLASAGCFITIVMALYMLSGRILKSRYTLKVFICLSVSFIVVLSAAAYARNTVWKSEISMLNDVVQKSPFKLRAHYSLGSAYLGKDRFEEAAREFKIVITLNPTLYLGYNGLGIANTRLQRYDEAVTALKTALFLKPNDPIMLINLGIAYMKQNKLLEASDALRNAVKIQSNIAPAHYNLGLVYKKQKEFNKAKEEFERALALQPDFAEAYNELYKLRMFRPGFDSPVHKLPL
jgi:tetratricopeptide (TPR) repeat protein